MGVCSETKPALLAGYIITIVAFVIHLIGFATPYWNFFERTATISTISVTTKKYFGLWKYCYSVSSTIVSSSKCVLDLAESRGYRFRSSSRYGSRVRYSRYSRVSRVPIRTKYSGYRLGSSKRKKAAIIAGTVYGARLWKKTSKYRRYYSYPEVCYNDIYEGNMTQKYYGRFVCPGHSDPDDYEYCCGSVGSQSCCAEPFDSSSSQGAGRIASIVIGVIFPVMFVGCCGYSCLKKRNSFQGKTPTIYFLAESADPLPPMGYDAAPSPSTTMTSGVQPLGDGNLPQPPSYGDDVNQSYPTPAPYSDPAYKPPMPSDDVNKGDLPYGIKPEPTPESGYMYGQPVQPGDTPYLSAPGEPAAYPPPDGAAPYPSAPGELHPIHLQQEEMIDTHND